jgi:hypothetical protein
MIAYVTMTNVLKIQYIYLIYYNDHYYVSLWLVCLLTFNHTNVPLYKNKRENTRASVI